VARCYGNQLSNANCFTLHVQRRRRAHRETPVLAVHCGNVWRASAASTHTHTHTHTQTLTHTHSLTHLLCTASRCKTFPGKKRCRSQSTESPGNPESLQGTPATQLHTYEHIYIYIYIYIYKQARRVQTHRPLQ